MLSVTVLTFDQLKIYQNLDIILNNTHENFSQRNEYINIYHSNSININENLRKSDLKVGRYLYGDYSVFEENKNFIYLLKDHISLINNILINHNKINELEELDEEIYKFHRNIQSKFTDFTKSIESTIFDFYALHHLKVLKILNENSSQSKNFFDTKQSFLNSLQNIEKDYTKNMKKYQFDINNKINDHLEHLVELFQIWLLKASANFPSSLIENSENIIEIKFLGIEDKNSITNITNSIILNNNSINESISKMLTYSFLKKGSLQFLFPQRKIADCNIKNFNLPIGYKVSISDKLKKSFKLSSKNQGNKYTTDKEPNTISLDNYYLSHIRLEKNRSLVIGISNEDNDIKSDRLFQIHLNLSDNNIDKYLIETFDKQKLKENEKNDLLQIYYLADNKKININTILIDFFDFVDFKKLFKFCLFILNTLEKVIDPLNLSTDFKLEYIKFNDKQALDVLSDKDQKKDKIFYDKSLILILLEIVTGYIAPIVSKIRDKSPVKGELILRYELEGQPRNEFVLKDSDLITQLNNFEEGKKFMEILDFQHNEDI